jgi:8-oxo-dGTP pyrophosphatase MutT (NUDIX family)
MKKFKEFYEESYWGSRGAGLVVRCGKNYLWTHRSIYVHTPHTWSLTIGGKVDPEDKSLLDAAKREFKEETNYSGSIKINPAPFSVFKDNSFTYTSFIADVPKEFELPTYSNKPEVGNWEIDDWEWAPYNKKFTKIHFGTNPIIVKLDLQT